MSAAAKGQAPGAACCPPITAPAGGAENASPRHPRTIRRRVEQATYTQVAEDCALRVGWFPRTEATQLTTCCSRSRPRARSRLPRAARACRCGPSRSARAAPGRRDPASSAGSHSCERMKAFAQCRNASSRSTPITAFGGLPCQTCRATSSGSVVMQARPLTRSVSAMPGIRKSRPMRPLCMTLRSVSSRLLPLASGITRRVSSSTETKPGAPPRGETSQRALRVDGGDEHERRRAR